jgi:hypothetical protein
MEANENCSHINCFLAPLSLMKIRREIFKDLHVENQFFHDVKYLVASVFKYQVFVQFFSFATNAIKN